MALLISLTFLGGSVHADSLNRMMVIDQSGNVYSREGESSTWYQQIGAPTTAKLIAAGGTRMAVVATSGSSQALWAKNTQLSGWSLIESGGVADKNSVAFGQESSGGPQLSVGPTGQIMIIDPAGNAYAQLDDGSNRWIQESSGGLTVAVAVGGLNNGNARGSDGRMMIIDWYGKVWSKDSIGGTWLKQTDSQSHAVAVGANGEMMLINCCGDAYAKLNPTDPWVQETGHGGTNAIAVGGKGRMMVIDSAGNAYSKDSLRAVWVLQVTGAKAIAVGSSGRMVVVDSANHLYFKDNTYDVWTADPVSNYGSPLINYIAIN